MIYKPLNELSSEWKQYGHLFTREDIPPKTTLLSEGEISETAYLIEKGCVRLWFNNNGKDVTFQFFFEGEAVSSIESFSTNRPSLFNLETIEPCAVLKLSRGDFLHILEDSPEIKREINEIILQRLIHYQELFLSRIKDKPEERYEELVRKYPKILQRVPQHYIASYLGITAVSLSRIRSRR